MTALPLTDLSGTSVTAAVRLFVLDALGSGVQVIIQGTGTVPQTAPYAVVSVVSDVDVTPTSTIVDAAAGEVAYRSHREMTAQVSVQGGYESQALAQRLAILWRSDAAAARASVARGLAPSTAGTVRQALTDGGAETVMGATVDLTGYYCQTIGPVANPDALVTEIDGDLAGARDTDPDAVWSLTIDGSGQPAPGGE